MKRSPEADGVSEVEAEAGFLRLIAWLLRSEIDAELLALLKQPDVAGVLSLADPWIALDLERDWGRAEFESAAVEFCRLFVMPARCAPLASAWLGGSKNRTESAVADLAGKVEAQLGLELPPPLASLPGDHLSRLLEVEAWLLLNLEDGEAQANEFREATMSAWVPPFAARLQSESDSPIYRAVGHLLAQTFATE